MSAQAQKFKIFEKSSLWVSVVRGSHQKQAALHVPLPDCAQSNARERTRTRTHAAACTQKMQCARSMTQKLNERIIPSSQFACCTAHCTALLARSISYYSRDHLSSFCSIEVRSYGCTTKFWSSTLFQTNNTVVIR